MRQRIARRFSKLALAVAGLMAATPAFVAETDIADEPLAQAASGVQPNIMFILDASGSMAWDFSPDYVDDSHTTTKSGTALTTAACFDSGDDDSGAITGNADACDVGDPPYMSPDFNKQYYNPNIFYRPGVNADGSDMINMSAGNTSNWTAVPTDPYGVQQSNQLGSSTSTQDLVGRYPDRAWCKDEDDDPSSTTSCRVNSAYTYPNHEFKYGENDFNNVLYRYGNPYYYRMRTAQWCSSAALTTCVSGSSVDAAVHKFIAPEFCTDSELTNCAAGAAITAAHTFSGPRWCKDQGTLLDCQRKKVGDYKWPKHLGVTKTVSITQPAVAAQATITVTQAVAGEKITNITVAGVKIIGGDISAASTDTAALATAIAAAIQSHVSSPDYTAVAAGSTVTITAATSGASANGRTLVVTSTQTGTGSATATIDVDSSNSNDDVYVDGIWVTHPTLGKLNLMSASCSGSYGNSVFTSSGGSNGNRLEADRGTNSSAERNSMAAGMVDCINEKTSTTGFTATRSGEIVTVTAPASLGALMNGTGITVERGGNRGSYDTSSFTGGSSSMIQTTSSASLSGGADPTTGTLPWRLGVGQFSRVDIEPANDSYPKAAGRTDCIGATCTYAEEMTNFANWYAYYRTRMQMMKSAAGRAFIPIDDTYRVGFITIKPFADPNNDSGSVDAGRYLKIDEFDPAHKVAWYQKFYDQSPRGGTPLREALSRVGRLYAGKFDGINSGIPSTDDPVLESCQPNFAILSSDGYWNGNGGVTLGGASLGQQDNADAGPYSLRRDGVFDGNLSSATVGLADVALYYYKNDLRPASATNAATGVDVSENNVPNTDKDRASHQHMTTFTLGLGLDGMLSYRSDYETASTGDFAKIKTGPDNWPNPKADAPEALDDLWHAAVNGRGIFFSASNPQELARSLSDTLDALKKRVGAGAAAATSNLQPVAGDNFAFTAQYETQTWIGDVKARTIDLENGNISFIELWSAQQKLNARAHTSRSIFTLDTSDTLDLTSTGATNNQLKHFCTSSSVVSGSGWCEDGSGLTATEEAWFRTDQLPQAVSYTAGQLTNATTSALVQYLRGHQAYEDRGTVADTDLFRERAALLGDIVNAQPAYVKGSPFNYSDTGYQDFQKCTEGTTTVSCPAAQFPEQSASAGTAVPRLPTVYIAANDGMLHAIETDVNNAPYYQLEGIATDFTSDDKFSTGNNTGNGEERWAYIPGTVLPHLYKLASVPYNHRYFVDGSPTVGDICISTPCAGLADWRTVLVAGLNSGGRGFYALDVTNPRKPRALWEFKVRKPSERECAATPADAVGSTDDCDLGLSFGNPVITKLASGKWVVIVTSGLNNVGVEPVADGKRMGDGKGYLYILDAITGAIIHKIPTNVGEPGTEASGYDDADPSGLAKINSWVDDALVNNTALAIYGGDMKGNLWRFDLDPSSSKYLTAVRVAQLKDSLGNLQPITTKPELGFISTRRVIFVGTGRFLGDSDKADTKVQSIYAIADDTTGHTESDRSKLVQQVISNDDADDDREMSTVNDVDWSDASIRGWFIDLPDTGERVNVDPQLQLGTLVVASNVPSTNTCTAGGTGWINTFNFRTGGFVDGVENQTVSQKISASVAVGINVIQLPGGKVVTIVTTADNQQLPYETPIAPTTFQGRRVSWRELLTDQ